MDRETLCDLLEKKPGYEAVHLLLESNQRRQDIVNYVETQNDISGGTVQDWLRTAQREGLISTLVSDEPGRQDVLYSLNIQIPYEVENVIHKRGGDGGRDSGTSHADVSGYSNWDDDYSICD